MPDKKLGTIISKSSIKEGMSVKQALHGLLKDAAVVAKSDDSDISSDIAPEQAEQILANTHLKIVDPQGDPELLDEIYRKCTEAGRDEDFHLIRLEKAESGKNPDPEAGAENMIKIACGNMRNPLVPREQL